jgi:hypothetical protein
MINMQKIIITCCRCGKQAQEGDTEKHARALAYGEGFIRWRVESGAMCDFCARCNDKEGTP